jgi:Protein of unknown function (DUF2948)
MATTKSLRLLADTPEDLEILSAAVQDSVIKAENLNFDRRQRRFALELNRYRWEQGTDKRRPGERVRTLLAFEGVLSVRTRAISKRDPELILSLLGASWTPAADPPGGAVTLVFAGDGEIVLNAEMLEASLLDSDYVWPTRHLPDHQQRRR